MSYTRKNGSPMLRQAVKKDPPKGDFKKLSRSEIDAFDCHPKASKDPKIQKLYGSLYPEKKPDHKTIDQQQEKTETIKPK
ncbi:MAG TPA: hypothetical protein VL360_06925 [Gammaproteobacteria bacterium]|jgi:hypothetical protein|nr:hypothetical protein [Gammaproteobacteria bacterium]